MKGKISAAPWAQELVQRKGNSPEEWNNIFDEIQSMACLSELKEEGLRTLVEASQNPAHLLFIARVLEEHFCIKPTQGADSRTGYKALIENVDSSPYSLSDWIEALHAMAAYLEKKGQRGSLLPMLGYVSCASEAAATRAEGLPQLSKTVTEFLEQSGFDAAQEQQSFTSQDR